MCVSLSVCVLVPLPLGAVVGLRSVNVAFSGHILFYEKTKPFLKSRIFLLVGLNLGTNSH